MFGYLLQTLRVKTMGKRVIVLSQVVSSALYARNMSTGEHRKDRFPLSNYTSWQLATLFLLVGINSPQVLIWALPPNCSSSLLWFGYKSINCQNFMGSGTPFPLIESKMHLQWRSTRVLTAGWIGDLWNSIVLLDNYCVGTCTISEFDRSHICWSWVGD